MPDEAHWDAPACMVLRVSVIDIHRYADAIDALEIYLNDVELPPTDNQEYQVNNDMTVPSLCQGSFCI